MFGQNAAAVAPAVIGFKHHGQQGEVLSTNPVLIALPPTHRWLRSVSRNLFFVTFGGGARRTDDALAKARSPARPMLASIPCRCVASQGWEPSVTGHGHGSSFMDTAKGSPRTLSPSLTEQGAEPDDFTRSLRPASLGSR